MPFRLKAAAVWVVLFLLLGFLGNAAGFDVDVDPRQLPLHPRRPALHDGHRGLRHRAGRRDGAARGARAGSPATRWRTAWPASTSRSSAAPRSSCRCSCSTWPCRRSGATSPRSYTWLPDGFDQAFVLEATTAGILALGLNYGAYMTEIFRAGIQSVAGGQGEAADALGMTLRPEDAQGGAAAGVPGDHPADRQRVHRDDEGHRAGLLPRRDRRDRRGLPPLPARRQGRLQEPRGVRRRGARLLGPHRALHVLPGPAGEAASAGATTGRTSRRAMQAQEPH